MCSVQIQFRPFFLGKRFMTTLYCKYINDRSSNQIGTLTLKFVIGETVGCISFVFMKVSYDDDGPRKVI